MKKILAAVAVAAVLVAGAVAEITFGTWMRVQAAVVASDGNDLYAGMENSWGDGARTGRLNIHGVDDEGKVGMESQIFLSVDSNEVGYDQIYFWIKPIDQLQLLVGKFDGSTGGHRGDFYFGSFNWLRPNTWINNGEGLTFDGTNYHGLMIKAFPIDGLQIIWNIPLGVHISAGKQNTDGDAANSAVWKYDGAKAQYLGSTFVVMYDIGSIGRLKVGYIGNYCDYSDDGYDDGVQYGWGEVAFDLKAVENLWLTAGFKYHIMDGDLMADWENASMIAALGASYNLGNIINYDNGLTLYAVGELNLYNTWDDEIAEQDPRFCFGFGVDFGILENLIVQADIRYINETSGTKGGVDQNDEDDGVSFLIGLLYNLSSNGEIGIGFQGVTNGLGFGNGDDDLKYEDKFAWAIPVRLGIWF